MQITLPTIYPFVFQVYVNWLYKDHLYIADTSTNLSSFFWKQCYELADLLQDCTFKDALIGTLIENIIANDAQPWGPTLPKIVYSSTTRESPHRKLLVDLAVHTWHSRILGFMFAYGRSEHLPQEFHLDVMAALVADCRSRAARTEQVSPREFLKDIDTCMYHEHTVIKVPYSITPCYKTRHET